jgi:hypothetical protein
MSMKPLRIWWVLLGLLGALACFAPASAASATSFTVTPEIGPPGTRFLFFASGFAAHEQLSFWLNHPNGQAQNAVVTDFDRTDTNGNAVWTWTAADDTARGGWQMVAHGRKSGVEAVIPFTIGDPPAPDATQPSNVEPRSGDPGALFRFFATGFKPGEYVDVQVHQPDGTAVTAGLTVSEPASPAGRIDGSWTSPATATAGEWQIIARGAESGFVQTLTVTIGTPSAAAPAQLVATPAVGSPGLRFSFSATGFAADEQLSIWVNRPDGSSVAVEVEGATRAGPDGRAGWTWLAPADAPLGDWQMVAHGRTSGREAVASFTLRGA